MKWFRFVFVVIALGLAGCASLNQNDRYVLQQHRVSPALYDAMVRMDPISLNDIIELSQDRVPPRFIVHYLRSTRASYKVPPARVRSLKKSGVSQEVIDYLLSTPGIYAPCAYYPREAVYSDPYYYPYGYYSRPYPYDYPYGYGFGYPTVVVGGGYYGGWWGGPRHHW